MEKIIFRKGKRIGRYDDRLIIRSVIFSAVVVILAVLLVFYLTGKNQWQSRAALLFTLLLLSGARAVLFIRRDEKKDLRNRQAMARMLLENRWFETEPLQRYRQGGRMERITYFPALYYRRRKRNIDVTVKISMGKYQDKLLHLEEKLETGLCCELVKKDMRDVWVRYEFLTNVEKNRITVAEVRAENGKLALMSHIAWEYDKLPHMLVSGETGSGKTVFLLTVIEGLLRAGAELVIADPKKADLSDLDQILPAVWCEKEDIMECIRLFCDDMEVRYDEMKRQPGRRMGMNYADLGMEPHFLIFDEYVAFMEMLVKKEWEEITSLMKQIIMKGRQAGYFIILACQRPDAKYLGDGIRDQFGFRVALGKTTASGYTMMFGSTDKEYIEKDIKGRGYVNTGRGVITEFYAPFVSKEHDFFAEIAGICKKREPEIAGPELENEQEAGAGQMSGAEPEMKQ